MKIYIDFDGTLFNSTKLYNNFIKTFNKYNIKTSYTKNILLKNKNYDTAAKKIINEFNLDKSIYKELNNIYSKNLLFKDTIPFLEKYYQKCI